MLICKTNEEQEGVELTFEFLENASKKDDQDSEVDFSKNVIQLGDGEQSNRQLIDIIQDLNNLDIECKQNANTDDEQEIDLLELMDS